MTEEWQAYINDPRTVCKYGVKCYQKNPEHHKNFKHPPTKKRGSQDYSSPANKRYKESPKNNSHIQETVQEDSKNNDGENESNKGDIVVSSSSGTQEVEQKHPEVKLPENITYHVTTDTSLFKDLFLVEMPKDFFEFFKCIQNEPNYEKVLKSVNLELIGPFDLLMGRLPVLEQKELYLIHWRFFYDPPEFQAIIKKSGKNEYHIGYFRDEPDKAPVFVASADSAKGYHITPIAENVFAAVYLYLQNEKKTSPFTSVACQKLMEKIKNWAESHKYTLEEYDMKKRLQQSITKTLHGAGIVVPYNKKNQLGYRKLVETDANLKKLFTKLESAESQREKDKLLSELQPVITYASIAVDECDFGTGLEAGLDLFCSGIKELQSSALSSLQAVYALLNRQAFSEIVQTHIKYRRKGPNMSVLSLNDG